MAKVEIPETHYARNGPISIAYQTMGDGPIDVLYLSAGITHLDYWWQYPPEVHWIERFTAFGRYVMYDKRGSGLSDRTVESPTVEEEVSDAVAVLDASGVDAAHLFGDGAGGATALALAAAHPDRVERVAVLESFPRLVASEDYPWGLDLAVTEALAEQAVSDWGGSESLGTLAPEGAENPAYAAWFTAMTRAGASPGGAASWFRNLFSLDIRPILGEVTAPVLILNRQIDAWVDPRHSDYLAEHLPDARQVILPGTGYLYITEAENDTVIDETQEFFTGTRPARVPTRALATVMFTDIVDSTGRAAAMGDTAWRDLLQRHDDLTRQHVENHGGRVIKSTGDGALATFDDPDHAITAAQHLTTALLDAGIELRAGVHFGQIEIMGDDVAGLAVHLASRISALARPGETLVSRTVRDLMLGSPTVFDDRGTHDLKGIPGQWEVLAVDDRPPRIA